MERHERYDPEDIESLLSERGFDELLPDERAFVLRHMSGRDEYERMRALLHYVRPDERDRGTIEPEERVKQHVMATFRAQQRPQWRIWLNTLAAWAAPREASAMWRPALAFATLALLIVASVLVVRQFNTAGTAPGLAELQKEQVQPSKPESTTVGETDQPAVEDATTMVAIPSGSGGANEGPDPDTPESRTASMDANAEVDDMEHPAAAGTVDEALASAAMEERDGEAITPAAPPVPTVTSDQYSHVVTLEELSRNASTTNATGAVTAETRSKRATAGRSEQDASRSMAQDPQILGLVTAGW